MNFVENLTDVQRAAINSAIQTLESSAAFSYAADNLRRAFERTPRMREAWTHESALEETRNGRSFSLYTDKPIHDGFVKVRITEVL